MSWADDKERCWKCSFVFLFGLKRAQSDISALFDCAQMVCFSMLAFTEQVYVLESMQSFVQNVV